MTGHNFHNLFSGTALGLFALFVTPATAVTVNLDGTTIPTLSDAVAAAYAADDGPDIINISTNNLATSDGVQILLDQPITINGDGESNGDGDGTPCDILVDMTKLKSDLESDPAPPAVGDARTAYIEIASTGVVTLQDLNIHPNEDGFYGRGGTLRIQQMVCGIRMTRPVSDEGTYNLTRVNVSGSDENNNFVSLASGEDLYRMTGVKKWGGHNGRQPGGEPVGNVDATVSDFGAIILSGGSGAGTYNTVLDHCQAGLSFGMALNLGINSGTHQVLGGVYGHSGRDGIRVENAVASITGSHDDRVRIVRAANLDGDNSHSIEVTGTSSTVSQLAYIDIAGLTTANGLNLRGGNVDVLEFIRFLGKFERASARNEAIFITGANTTVGSIENITAFNNGQEAPNGVIPMTVTASIVDSFEIKDSIFASDTSGTVQIAAAAGLVTFTNSALPNDGFTSESLDTVPVTGVGAPSPLPATTVFESPRFALTLDDYDWSDNQGAGQPGNAVGNANVLRPTNAAYDGAASEGQRLNGGAGAAPAGIDSNLWMMM